MKDAFLEEAIEIDNHLASSLANWEVVTKVVQYSYNVGYDKFLCDLKYVLDMSVIHETYADEMWQRMRANFGSFYCNLTDEAKKRFVEVALMHYGYAIRID